MRDLKTEQFLDHGGWKWQYVETVPFGDIDIEASEANPARITHRIDDERVQSYALAMEAGDEFPAIVLQALDPGVLSGTAFKYLIATGVHRVEAAKLAGATIFDAYVVTESDKYRQECLQRQLNTIEGHGISIKDRILQVLHLHRTYPDHSLAALSKEWNLPAKTVRQHWYEQQAFNRALRFGYDFRNNKIPQRTVVALNGIHSDVVFERAVHYVVMTGANVAETEELVKELKKIRDENAGLSIIDRYAKEATDRKLQAQAKHGRISSAPATKFMQDGRRLQNLLDKGIENLHFGAHPRRDLLRSLAEQLIGSMKRVIADLDRIERMKNISTSVNPAHLVGVH
jgi:hypothetical protein